MTVLERILEVLPPPYAIEDDSVTAHVLDDLALELDAVQEDLDRVRRTHWVNFAYRFEDLDRLADLVGIQPIPGETLASFRVRLLALVEARLRGAVGPREIREFVHDYLSGAETALDSTFVPGLARYDAETAFRPDPRHPSYRPLQLVENPLRTRRSATLAATHGRVPYLFRWEERNQGLVDTVARFTVSGLHGGRTAVPLLVNMTTHDLIGYQGVLRVGQRLELLPADDQLGTRAARALLDGRDVTNRIFSVSDFELGVPFNPPDRDEHPQLTRLARGPNQWTFLSVGLYDVEGLNHVFYAIADDALREGSFDSTFFDHSVFPSGAVASLELEWTEVEPASFEVHVPRYLTIAAPEVASSDGPPADVLVAEALTETIREIHAAGVRAQVIFDASRETQNQRVRATLPWIVTQPETAPSGEGEELDFGGRYGESSLDTSRFE
jgi:hypothetical protein